MNRCEYHCEAVGKRISPHALRRLTREKIDHRTASLDQTQSFTFDLSGNRLSLTLDKGNDAIVDETTSYTYDSNDRLMTEARIVGATDTPGGAEKNDTTTRYHYYFPVSGGTSTIEGAQQTSKLVEYTVDGVDASLTSYSFNLQGRMSAAQTDTYNAAGTSVTRRERTTYGYDSQGNRVTALNETDSNGDNTYETRETTGYLHDPQSLGGYGQVIEETKRRASDGWFWGRSIFTYGQQELLAQTNTSYDCSSRRACAPLPRR